MSITINQRNNMVSGFVILLFLGIALAWSVFLVPVEATFGWNRGQTSLAATLNTMSYSIGCIITGLMCKKLSFSKILKIASILMFIGFYILSTMKVGSSVLILYISYGILIGIAVGMGYNCILSVCPLWMGDKVATANGILIMGYALSTALFAPAIQFLITTSESVTFVFRVLGIVCGIGIFIFSFFIRTPTIHEASLLPFSKKIKTQNESNIITSKMIKMPLFWMYYVISILFAGIGLSLLTHNAPILIEFGASSQLATLVVSLCALCNGVARFVFGFIYDYFGVKKSLLVIVFIFFISLGGIVVAFCIDSLVLYMCSICILLFGFGFNATSMPSILRSLFGHRTFSLNYSVLGTNAFLIAWFSTLVGVIQAQAHHYLPAIVLLICFFVLTVICLKIFFKMYDNR